MRKSGTRRNGQLTTDAPLGHAQALIAVRIGSVRLIDNLRLDHSATHAMAFALSKAFSARRPP